jgi:hypothetical protein
MPNSLSDALRLTSAQWLERCKARILAHDDSLEAEAVDDLAGALAGRVSCRALAPETAADLLFTDRYTRHDSER